MRVCCRAAFCLVAIALLLTPAAPVARAQQATFRSSVELIAIDVQVVDKKGSPVRGMGPDKFDVSLSGRHRKVVSAELIDATSSNTLALERAPAAKSNTVPAGFHTGRTIILAIDCDSFTATASRDVIKTARDFVARLEATDYIGIHAYPSGPQFQPTLDHAAISIALGTVIGQFVDPSTEFHLKPAELVDLSNRGPRTTGRSEPFSTTNISDNLCGANASCIDRLTREAASSSGYYEAQAVRDLGMFRAMLRSLGIIQGRKTVVLLSAGQVSSDVPGGRPDLGHIGIEVGRDAAGANVSVYTLFIDQPSMTRNSVENRSNHVTVLQRDSAILSRWLDEFSGSAGGALLPVLTEGAESAFDRILSETSAYYLLGVLPDASDRDGRPHEIKVKVSGSGLTVRARTSVVVPKR